ncbi:cytochrome c-type biogenesis protein CycH [Neokomagataea thailandica NBRC 106555]|uniref:C-type cytochrome biogenesis protein CcmI n=2 Tax=Neokomagataea TaxID=1223423 RepID=A0A4Y6V777_9PROT|nr:MULTISPECIES: c-type cytochrome biogenesis protein CcmI [Neokomagataea]QDH24347.1 c-type cytochrome biogenesis protein CcmI [Neokomagataea tanensis]GBR53224.1 cytochrome c-type biogenesis protein CycH [Neokomagataea thailandica NBRC 106555]
MSWVSFLLITLIALLPVFLGLAWAQLRVGSRQSALALYRGQLTELDRDKNLGLVSHTDYAAAQLEIQRRLLTADSSVEDVLKTPPATRQSAWLPFFMLGLGIPSCAALLYLSNGHPSLAPEPLAARNTAPDAHTFALIQKLQTSVASFPTDSPSYVPGHTLLGQVEFRSGLTNAAIADWQAALAVQFSPDLALNLAEAMAKRDGRINRDTLNLYRRALAAAPNDAPWRMAVEARIAAGEHDLGEQQ